ncbi:hypothetical protein EV359DRAFT_33661 [Lentinula novae-zelandiae]|nr:hypothetical protein EV359DRAFT_33661 [Lentinula novae-zelandiae]
MTCLVLSVVILHNYAAHKIPFTVGYESEADQLRFGSQRPAQRIRNDRPEWFPWSDKESCILDILRHLPRSLFSDAQMDIILWGVASFGVRNLPSTDVAKSIGKYLQSLCGIKTERQKGPLGHVYYLNELDGLIRQEMGNPDIRPHIRHYCEDSGQHLEHAWQAQAWKELDPTLATPMVRKGNQDFFVHELARLDNGTLVMPFRWFTRSSGDPGDQKTQILFGLAWAVKIVHVNGQSGYIISQTNTIQFPVHQLQSSFPYLVESCNLDQIPSPHNIFGIQSEHGCECLPWTLTSFEDGFANHWRVLAKGHEVLTFAMWLYCDDTSGNVSKKWNKHNSFLFTAAGLPHEHVHKESNVQFLCTSNLAPPLEMLDGITTQLERGQKEGFWVWDVQKEAMVLTIPAVLAMLGDNPMQSEFSCHVGLVGKYFCRCCFAKGRDANDEQPASAAKDVADDNSVHSNTSSERESDSGAEKKGGRRKETIQELISRAKRFIMVHESRYPQRTIDTLHNMFITSSQLGGKTKAKEMTTGSGVKDTFFGHFQDKIFTFIKKIPHSTPTEERQGLVDDFIAQNIPPEPSCFSPIWRMKGLDPHRDTPVEILHVILLGFVKYYWRDAITRLDDPQKETLKHRLSSLDVSSMGLSPLAGETLVKYARSLTGRDFRAIAQVAPFVLYDLLPAECYEAWLALSALIPLVWQPVILHLDTYLATLELAIEHFLNCAAHWTPRWFNKPKFHIICHLPMHIRRFGPAMLYATEGFESFNAIIRDHSVHSNHQAPSRDIGRGFAQCSRVRHLLHRGVFFRPVENQIEPPHLPFSDDSTQWVTAAALPIVLARTGFGKWCSPVASAYGLNVVEKTELPIVLPNHIPDGQYHVYEQAISYTHEPYKSGDYVIVGTSANINGPVGVARVHEILVNPQFSSATLTASAILVQTFKLGPIHPKYKLHQLMPAQWALLPPQNVLCPVDTQHNCAGNNCDLSKFRAVRQERELTEHRLPRTHHHNDTEHQRLLNTNQMRSGVFVQRLRPTIPPLDPDLMISEGATREIQAQMAATHKGKTRAQPLARNQSPLAARAQTDALSSSPPTSNPILQRFIEGQQGRRRVVTCQTCGQLGHNSRTCGRRAGGGI